MDESTPSRRQALFETLSDHLHVKVFQNLDFKSRLRLERTSKRWQANLDLASAKQKVLYLAEGTPQKLARLCTKRNHQLDGNSIVTCVSQSDDNYLHRIQKAIDVINKKCPALSVLKIATSQLIRISGGKDLFPHLEHLEVNGPLWDGSFANLKCLRTAGAVAPKVLAECPNLESLSCGDLRPMPRAADVKRRSALQSREGVVAANERNGVKNDKKARPSRRRARARVQDGSRLALEFEALPDHIHVQVFEHLDFKARVRLEHTSRRWQANLNYAHSKQRVLWLRARGEQKQLATRYPTHLALRPFCAHAAHRFARNSVVTVAIRRGIEFDARMFDVSETISKKCPRLRAFKITAFFSYSRGNELFPHLEHLEVDMPDCIENVANLTCLRASLSDVSVQTLNECSRLQSLSCTSLLPSDEHLEMLKKKLNAGLTFLEGSVDKRSRNDFERVVRENGSKLEHLNVRYCDV